MENGLIPMEFRIIIFPIPRRAVLSSSKRNHPAKPRQSRTHRRSSRMAVTSSFVRAEKWGRETESSDSSSERLISARERTMEDIMRDELGAPRIVDRSTFQAELDALRVREKAQ